MPKLQTVMRDRVRIKICGLVGEEHEAEIVGRDANGEPVVAVTDSLRWEGTLNVGDYELIEPIMNPGELVN